VYLGRPQIAIRACIKKMENMAKGASYEVHFIVREEDTAMYKALSAVLDEQVGKENLAYVTAPEDSSRDRRNKRRSGP
jgi:hypothetical protein